MPLEMGSTLEVTVRVNLLVLVRESAPADWFDGIIDVMGDVVDALHVTLQPPFCVLQDNFISIPQQYEIGGEALL